ncbi:hypothetical protein [Ottowia oryzae]|nr:hypothetical protein [Ottowia oryzae]
MLLQYVLPTSYLIEAALATLAAFSLAPRSAACARPCTLRASRVI